MTNDPNSAEGKASIVKKDFYRDNEHIDIFDLAAQLWAGKKTIILATVIFAAAAVLYIFMAEEKWTSDAIVTRPTPGQIANYNAALNVLYSQYPRDKTAVQDLQAILFSRFIASASALSGELLNREDPLNFEVKQVVAGKDDSYRVSFTAETAQEAQKKLGEYINGVDNGVVDDFGSDIKRNLAIKEKELKESLATQIKVAEEKKQQRIAVLKQALMVAHDSSEERTQLTQAEFLSDDTLYLLGAKSLSSMISNESTGPLNLDSDYYTTQHALFAIRSLNVDVDQFQSFRFIMKPDLPVRRDSPKKGLTLILAIILGGIAGSAIILCRNMSASYRMRNS